MHFRRWRTAPAGLAAMLVIATAIGAEYPPDTVVSGVGGAGGAPASGGGIAANGTLAQPTPVGVATGGGLVLHGGFWYLRGGAVSGVDTPSADPLRTRLGANYPNPFNPRTRIDYDLAAPCRVRLEVFDARGRRVRTLVAAEQPAGRYHAVWTGDDDAGRPAASGLYFYRLRAGDFQSVMKMTLVK